jgi:hypothetical protein
VSASTNLETSWKSLRGCMGVRVEGRFHSLDQHLSALLALFNPLLARSSLDRFYLS